LAKDLLSEQQLLEVINIALAKDWVHKDCHCSVGSLRKINHPERNWEAAGFNTGGITLRCPAEYTAKCDALRQRVLEEMVRKYDVLWSE